VATVSLLIGTEKTLYGKPKSRREKGEGLRRKFSSTFTIGVSPIPSTSTVLRLKTQYKYKNLTTQQNQQTHNLKPNIKS